VAADLAAHRLPAVVAALDSALDAGRDPAAVDWCLDAGLRGGHVAPLYKAARNALKWATTGRVPTGAEVAFGLYLALVLLLRVAQDVQACVSDLGRTDRACVYDAFRAKVAAWVGSWPVWALPPDVRPVADRVAAWAAARAGCDVPWPSPAWVAAFKTPTLVGTTFTFAAPSASDVAAFARCQTLPDTRAEVTDRLRAVLEAAADWPSVLRGLAGLVATPE
jgi:hypothetical protein